MGLSRIPNARVFTLISLGAVITLATARAADLETTSSVDHITIFPGSAKVTRTARVNVPAGQNNIEITDLPLNLIQTSLRVNGQSDANVSLGSVTLKNKVNTTVVLEKERLLKEKIEQLSLERTALQDKINRQQSQLSYIEAMGSGGGSDMGSRYLQLPMDQWQAAWTMLEEATATAQQQIRDSSKELRAIDAELKKLNTQLRQVASNQRSTRVANLSVVAEQATPLSLSISYLINGASWAPVYDADLNTETGQLELKTQAEIRQRTGENWKQATVTLSTLRPSESSQLPTLEPWSIDYAPEIQAFPAASGRMMMSEEMAPMAEADMAMAKSAAPRVMAKPIMQAEESVLVSADFSASYQIPNTVTLDSGSEKKRFALSTDEYDTEIVLASTPRLDPRVLLTSSIDYKGQTPLLAGNLSLYRDGNYVGSTYVSQYQPGETIKLSFGEDDKVKLTFQPDPDAKSDEGIFFGKRKMIKRAYQVTVSNQHDAEYPVHMFDNIPVASHEDIKVELTGDAPTARDIDDKKGVMRWERTLKPNSEQRLRYGYQVSYPQDKRVFGFE